MNRSFFSQLLILLLSLCSVKALAQTDSTKFKSWGGNVMTYIGHSTDPRRANSVITHAVYSVSREIGKSSFNIGINSPIGVNIGYAYFPNNLNNRFNLYFRYDVNIMRLKLRPYKYEPYYVLTNSIGYGVRLNINSRWYIENSVNAGAVYQKFVNPSRYSDDFFVSAIYKIALGYQYRKVEKGKIFLLK